MDSLLLPEVPSIARSGQTLGVSLINALSKRGGA